MRHTYLRKMFVRNFTNFSLFQDESNIKRFKSSPLAPPAPPAPILISKDETSLKIRISRYGTAPGRAQHKSFPLDEGSFSNPGSPAGSPRLSRRAGSLDPSPVKPELKMCSVKLNNLSSVKTEKSEIDVKPHPAPILDIKMTSSEIVSECERVGPGLGEISTSVLDEGEPCPLPKRRHQLPKLSSEQLLPNTPCVHVKNKQEAFSPQLREWCLQRPITVIRGLPQACDMDLSLYTTKSLVESHPNHPVEIRTQLEQSSDENWDPSLSKEVTTSKIFKGYYS